MSLVAIKRPVAKKVIINETTCCITLRPGSRNMVDIHRVCSALLGQNSGRHDLWSRTQSPMCNNHYAVSHCATGILLVLIWYIYNLKVHSYICYWWVTTKELENKDATRVPPCRRPPIPTRKVRHTTISIRPVFDDY